MKLFKRNKKETKTRKDHRAVYAYVQWTDNRGRTAERMSKACLENYVDLGLIYPDYDIIGYL
jgi:hypothetical protein